jgi:uncharacterized SAM-binding protein YcdF (DUF218 family)
MSGEMLDYIAHILISPLNQTLLGLLTSVLLLKFTKIHKAVVNSIILTSLIWLWLCSQFFFSHWLISPLEKAHKTITIDNPLWQQTTATWVLACYHFDDDTITLVSQFNHCSLERLVHAASMYHVNKAPIYLTGGFFNHQSKVSHAEYSSKLLMQLGVNEKDIIVVAEGQNTLQEAAALKKHLQHETIAVVSSATHGIRLHKVLNSEDIEFVFVPVHFSSKGKNNMGVNFPSLIALRRSERAMYEYAAIVKHWIYQ